MKNLKKIMSLLIMFTIIVCLGGCTLIPSNTESNNQAKNAYQLAVENGFEGSLDDWLDSLVKNESYKSIYNLAIEEGLFDGTLEEFIESLKGEKGETESTDIEKGSAFAVNSIVSVYCNYTATYTTRDWWGRIQEYSSNYSGAGSGVIIKDEKDKGIAYIITNYHVVYDSDSNTGVSDDIYVYLYGMEYDGYKIPATYLGGSMSYDIAVLRIESDTYKNSGAYCATVFNSSLITVGTKVIAIGNPEAQGISVTAGIVSVPNETITMTAADEKTSVDQRVIRIDAAVNSGNSGGGLFDSNGKLIGIVNAKSVDTEIEGMCYAIPINVAYAVATKIIETCDGDTTKTIKKVVLGINIKIINSGATYDPEKQITTIKQTMAVSDVSSSGSSYGILKENDILVSISYKGTIYEINNQYSIEETLLLVSKNDTITICIERNSTQMTFDIALSNETNIK